MTRRIHERLAVGMAVLVFVLAGGVLLTIQPVQAQDRDTRTRDRDGTGRVGRNRDRQDRNRRGGVDLERFLFTKAETNNRKITLKIAKTTITDHDLRGVQDRKFADLEALDANGSQIGDDGLRHFVGLSLTDVNLHSTQVTDRGMEHLAALPLRHLSLGYTDITDDGLRALRGLPLDELMLANTDVTDAGLAYLKGMPLRKLNLTGTRVTDEGLVHLRRVPLEGLGLPRHITDQGLANLRLMPLQSLNLGGTSVTDEGLRQLEDLPLKLLWLYGTNVTDAAVESLEKMTELDSLFIQNTHVSEAAANRLRRSIRYVFTGRSRPNYKQMVLEVFLSHQDLERAGRVEMKDPFDTRMVIQLIRAQGRPQAAKLGMDPNNIGISEFDFHKFKRDERGYRGTVLFTFYPKRQR